MTARRSRDYTTGEYNPDEAVAPEGEVTATEVEAPLTEQQRKLNELDGYYGKVLSDLDREKREADAVHDATEKRLADLEAQKAQIDAEYAERKAAIEAEAPTPETDAAAKKPPTRWGVHPAPRPQPALTS
jgi:peptidoglycan hydrolase CwlO-like protein